MLSVSATELLIVLLVGAVLLKPKDWIKVMHYLRHIRKSIAKMREIFSESWQEISNELEEMEKEGIKYIKGDDKRMHKSYQNKDNI